MSVPVYCNSPTRFPKSAEVASSRLRNSRYRALRNVLCERNQGVVILKGHLPSFYYKQLAQEAVAGVRGVIQVINEIEVD
jgi:osmotically-inducible protein OsmY